MTGHNIEASALLYEVIGNSMKLTTWLEKKNKEDYFAHESPHAEWREPWDRAYRCGFWEANMADTVAAPVGAVLLDIQGTLLGGDGTPIAGAAEAVRQDIESRYNPNMDYYIVILTD